MRAACWGPRMVIRIIAGLMLPLGSLAGAGVVSPLPAGAAAVTPACLLASPSGAVSHVIYIQFDNTHLTRDNPNVPSDLEQMPNLLNFIKDGGVLLSQHHTPLISHTATDILTSLTGVYGDRHGVPVANSFRYFNPNGTTNPGVSFAYWTSPIFDPSTSTPSDTKPNMLTADGKNAPAPWVPFTRAGCNVGAVATANTILENNSIDIPTVFGAGSDESKETPAQQTADFVGIGVHCGLASVLCATAAHAKDDKLPDEPGGYTGFKALYGHKYTAEAIGPISDLDGNAITGFPGFDGMSASVSLGYVAAMQEHGIPVTYAYISDAHDKHTSPTRAYGPGEEGYVAQLKAYDTAFGKFFARMALDGINRTNTLFVFTADENDHLSSGPPDNPACNGVTLACTYSHGQLGELNTNLSGLLATEQGNATPFTVHSDDAPTVYITGNPGSNDAVTRRLEQDSAKLSVSNPRTGQPDQLTQRLANSVEMKLLHMVTADAARTPTFTLFGNPDYFFFTSSTGCANTTASPCVTVNPAFAWNHGDFQQDIVTTWLGMVGPGVANPTAGIRTDVWSDHTDIRPTILSLTGLKDDYQHQGRVLFEIMNQSSVPPGLLVNEDQNLQLAQAYKQIEAPVGELGLNSLLISTCAESSADNGVFNGREGKLTSFTQRRDEIGDEIANRLEAAEFAGTPILPTDSARLIAAANALRADVAALANSPCSSAASQGNPPGGQTSNQQPITLAQTGGGPMPNPSLPIGLLLGAGLLAFGLVVRRRIDSR
jgi:hypothetical protein